MTEEPVGTGQAVLVRPDRTYEGAQGLTYGEGVFADNTGARGLCLHVLRIPPGGRARTHLHAHHESAIYLVVGAVSVLHGAGLAHRTSMEAGDFLYIPPDCPHVPVNTGNLEAFAVLARTDPNEQESVVLLPSLEALADERLRSDGLGEGTPAADEATEGEGSEGEDAVPVASRLLARAAALPDDSAARGDPGVLFGWASRLTAHQVLAMGRAVDALLAGGAPADAGRGFGVAWTGGVRLPPRPVEQLLREFTQLEVVVGGVLAGHTLGSPLPSPAPGGLGGLLNAFGRRPSPASPEADAIIERGGRPARFGLTATWNTWMAMRYRAIIAPPTFELLVGPWVSVVGPLPPA